MPQKKKMKISRLFSFLHFFRPAVFWKLKKNGTLPVNPHNRPAGWQLGGGPKSPWHRPAGHLAPWLDLRASVLLPLPGARYTRSHAGAAQWTSNGPLGARSVETNKGGIQHVGKSKESQREEDEEEEVAPHKLLFSASQGWSDPRTSSEGL